MEKDVNIVIDINFTISVEDKICRGTECKEMKSSTSNKEGDQVDEKSTVPSTTPGTD